eukprot:TRINITY_DN3347_c0_g1_i1.p1 TRINITY_DN3347_c0_g1~~TRINITY_DN3347_c0_g1_i1.p1  ORF type:complete len:181 (+),score=37.94 TRINITY_DN3347_c0_g1_i1:321-863(+)
MSRHPEVKWAQRSDKLYITILLPDSKNANVKLEPEGKLIFSATAGADSLYQLNLDLHDKVNVEASKINVGVRNIVCVVEKAEKGWWKKLLKGGGKPPQFLKVDWDKWVDEDEENEKQFDFGGMDFSSMGGGDDDVVSDDEEEEPPEANSNDKTQAEGEKTEMDVETSNVQEKSETDSEKK